MSAPDQRIRQVAIVLQSLDSGTSRGLLAQLPPEMARAVRQAMVNLGTVTPKERAQAMSGMQGMLGAMGQGAMGQGATSQAAMGRASSQVEQSSSPSPDLEASSPAASLIANSSPLDQIEFSSASQRNDLQHSNLNARHIVDTETPWLGWEPASLAIFLADERPTVIATVINQLSPERAKELLDHLPITTASATLAAIPDLFLTDPQILSDILAEIDRKLPKTAPVQKTATIAGISKLVAIMEQFGESQKQAWLDSIALQNESVAKQLGWSAKVQPLQVQNVSSTIDRQSFPTPVVDLKGSVAVSQKEIAAASQVMNEDDIFDDSMIVPIGRYQESIPNQNPAQNPDPSFASSDRDTTTNVETAADKNRNSEFDILLGLSDIDLVTLLHSCEKSDVLAALCGASKQLIQRIERLIPRDEVRRFRSHLKQRASVSSHEVDVAQSAILLRAEQLMIASRISALSSVTFVSAA